MHSYSVLLSTAISATPPPLLVYIPQPQERGLDMPQRTHRLPIVGCIPATGRSAICALSLLPTGYELDRPEVSGLHGSVCQTPPAGSAGDYASFPCLHFQFPYSLAFDSNISLTISPPTPSFSHAEDRFASNRDSLIYWQYHTHRFMGEMDYDIYIGHYYRWCCTTFDITENMTKRF